MKKDGGIIAKRAGSGRMRVRVSVLVWLYAAVSVLTGRTVRLLSYLAAILLHELAHAAYARKRGYVLGELKLMPYGAALIGEFEDAPSADEWRIAAVGPLASLTLAALTAAVWWQVPALYAYTPDFALANLSLGLTNLLPVYPLDGGRIALALLSAKFDRARTYRVLRACGAAVGAAFTVLFALSCLRAANPSLLTMSAFILQASLVPDERSRYCRLYEASGRRKKLRRGLTVREIMVGESAPARVLIERAYGDAYVRFTVVSGDMERVAAFEERDLSLVSGGELAGTAGEVAALIEKRKHGSS